MTLLILFTQRQNFFVKFSNKTRFITLTSFLCIYFSESTAAFNPLNNNFLHMLLLETISRCFCLDHKAKLAIFLIQM